MLFRSVTVALVFIATTKVKATTLVPCFQQIQRYPILTLVNAAMTLVGVACCCVVAANASAPALRRKAHTTFTSVAADASIGSVLIADDRVALPLIFGVAACRFATTSMANVSVASVAAVRTVVAPAFAVGILTSAYRRVVRSLVFEIASDFAVTMSFVFVTATVFFVAGTDVFAAGSIVGVAPTMNLFTTTKQHITERKRKCHRRFVF